MGQQFNKKAYELSLWKDFLVKDDKTEAGFPIESYYQEQKLCVFGSDKMTSPFKAINVILKEDVNGTNEIEFDLYSHRVNEKGEKIRNPFLDQIINESKVKLYYDNKWYEFIIKERQEDSLKRSYHFKGIDVFINELSKNGHHLIFDTELQNNQGTIEELAARTLKDTDWEVLPSEKPLQQRIEEVLYEGKIFAEDLQAIDLQTQETVIVPAGSTIYMYYSCLAKQTPLFQFVYETEYITDDRRVLENCRDLGIENVHYKVVDTSNEKTELAPSRPILQNEQNPFVSQTKLSQKYKGKRLVRSQAGLYDAKAKKVINIYLDTQKDNAEIYRYTKTEYSPEVVYNYLVNSEKFTSSDGWSIPEGAGTLKADFEPPYPSKGSEVQGWTDIVRNVLVIKNFKVPTKKSLGDQVVFNDSLRLNAHLLTNGLIKGEKYVFRIKYQYKTESALENVPNDKGLISFIAPYSQKDGKIVLVTKDDNPSVNPLDVKKVLDFSGTKTTDGDYQYIIATATETISQQSLKDGKVGVFLQALTEASYYIDEVQIFQLAFGAKDPLKPKEESMLLPGDTPVAKTRTKYFFYYPTEDRSEDSIPYEYTGYDSPSRYIPKNKNNFAKVRSIQEKESNRFNIIQSLCETFEAWVRYEIEHDSSGRILLENCEEYNIDESGNEILSKVQKRQKKGIRFVEYVGRENFAGFAYGVNLEGITRTINSDQITTKLIVADNPVEYADDGFCSIAKASENPLKTNFLLNFDYYVQQGLLNQNDLYNDLYLTTNGYLGYYTRITELGRKKRELIVLSKKLGTVLIKIESRLQAAELQLNASKQELSEVSFRLQSITGYTYDELANISDTDEAKTTKEGWLERDYVKSLFQEATIYFKAQEEAGKKYDQAKKEKEQIDGENGELTKCRAQLKEMQETLQSLDKAFFTKYARYIQEGTWNSKDFIDDNLYYFDADSVLYTSKSPEIKYDIKVYELSQLEEYQNYKFSVGDITYVEDPEFFGYTNNITKTPYKEKIIVSNIERHLDSPKDNNITVQNYKTQFEDLFQRISAQSQSLKQNEGNYNRAAKAVQPDGQFNAGILQNSLLNNSLIISNAKDNSVVFDEQGITVTNLQRPNEIIRLVSNGILLTEDGGSNWSLGISARGINANYLTAGQIDVRQVNIMSGDYPSFRWDQNGLAAYGVNTVGEGADAITSIDYNKTVNFNQYGLYGSMQEINYRNSVNPLEEINQKANFGFLWDRFFLNTNKGSVKISSDKDIQVLETIQKNGKLQNIERLRIGDLSKGTNKESIYGISINNAEGNPVVASTSDGNLALTGRLRIGDRVFDNDATSRVELGSLEYVYDKNGPQKVFTVKDPKHDGTDILYITDEGQLVGNNIHIKGGTIGNVNIADFSDSVAILTINPLSGTILYPGNQLIFKAEMGSTLYDSLVWNYTINGNYHEVHGNECIIKADEVQIDENDIAPIELSLQGVTTSGVIKKTSLYITIGNSDYVLTSSTSMITQREADKVVYLDPSEIYLTAKEVRGNTILDEHKGSILVLINNYLIPVIQYEEISSKNTEEKHSPIYYRNSKWVVDLEKMKTILQNKTDLKEQIIYGQLVNDPIQFQLDEQKRFDEGAAMDPPVVYEKIPLYFYDTLQKKFTIVEDGLLDPKRRYYIHDPEETFNTTLKTPTFEFMYINLEGETIASTFSNTVWDFSEELFKLDISAQGLNAALGEGGLSFDQQGLTITNNGFQILTDDPTKYFKVEDGNITFSGNLQGATGDFTGTINAANGVFGGTLKAASGSFSGDIQAKSGTLEKLTVIGDIQSENYSDTESRGYLLTKEGGIIAQQISLGEKATIKSHIDLGNTQLWNPKEEPDRKVLTFGEKKESYIKETGETKLGDILIDPNTSTIRPGQASVPAWELNSKGGYFSNVDISGTLNYSIFNPTSVQSSGGVTLFKDNYQIQEAHELRDIDSTSLKLSTTNIEVLLAEEVLAVKDRIWLLAKDQITFLEGTVLEKKESKKISDQKDAVTKRPKVLYSYVIQLDESLVTFSSEEENNIAAQALKIRNVLDSYITIFLAPKSATEDWFIGINATTKTQKFGLQPQSLTFNAYEAKTKTFNPKIILGNLSAATLPGNQFFEIPDKGAGLYAANAYLNGALVTQVADKDSPTYAGINTLSNIWYDKKDPQAGKIVFWAGAKSALDIENAPFKVSTTGELYASKGHFAKSLFVDADIYASIIHTAKVIGNDDKAALTITDAKKGLVFEVENQKEGVTFKRDKATFNLPTELNEGARISSFIQVSTKTELSEENTSLSILPTKIIFEGIRKNTLQKSVAGNLQITHENTMIELNDSGVSVVSNTQNFKPEVNFQASMVHSHGADIFYSDEIQYQAVKDKDAKIIGYNLYIME